MRRRIRWTCAGKCAGAVTLVVIAAIWLTSGWLQAWASGACSGRMLYLHLISGRLEVMVRPWQAEPGASGWNLGIAEWHPHRWKWRLERTVDRIVPTGPWQSTRIAIPLYLPFLFAAIAEAVWLWRLRRRRSPGACPKCGYDLTDNTTGICPECGKARPAETSSGT